MLARDRPIELAADRENRVADFFGTQTPACKRSEEISRQNSRRMIHSDFDC